MFIIIIIIISLVMFMIVFVVMFVIFTLRFSVMLKDIFLHQMFLPLSSMSPSRVHHL